MEGLGAFALISSLINFVTNLLPEVTNIFFAPSSSSSTQAADAHAVVAELTRLARMLERIRATLYDAEERNIQDKSIQLWLKEIKDLGHEVKIVLEKYMYEMYRAQVEARNASQLNPIKGDHDVSDPCSIQIPCGMVDHIRGIMSRFKEIAMDREALHLPEEDAPRREKTRYSPTFTSSVVVEESVFGREEEKKKIINSLVSGGDGIISVMPIVGKGGIGKTTVAKLVYNDERVKASFDLVGWVCVSYDLSVERICRCIIEEFTGEACKLESPNVLLEKIRNIVTGKRVFLVMDDVWDEVIMRFWESLRMLLMRSTKATILVTTQNMSVARIIQTMEPLQLEYLSEDKCWPLFTYYAFQGIHLANDQDKLVEIGQKIVKKCGGLPLAVRLIASLLSHEVGVQSWMEVLQNDSWESEVLAALQISYDRMPTYLKPCLLLCSMFPKDHEYSMNLMSKLWISNGFIEPNERKSAEEVAADCTKMLYERSFFDDYNIKYDNCGLPTDTTFRIHDMVHDLALLNSDKTCCSVEECKRPFVSKQVSHLYLSKEPQELSELLSSNNIQFVQTLILRGSWSIENRHEINLNSLSKAEHLRALDMKCEAEDAVPFSLGEMKHLHYLSVGAGIVERISPQSIFSCYSLRILTLNLGGYHMELDGIGNLINLESLQLFEWDTSVALPESIGLLRKLRLFEIHGFEEDNRKFELPESIGNLVDLHRIVISGATLKELPDSICRLANLHELILIRTDLEALPPDLGILRNLQLLFLQDLYCNIPLCCRKLFRIRMVMQGESCQSDVGCLKELHDQALMIKDICNHTTRSEDSQHVNLISMRDLETRLLFSDTNFQLRWLDPSELEVPRDYLCASLVKLSIRSFSHICSLPLGMVLSLKHLYKADRVRLLHLRRQVLSCFSHITSLHLGIAFSLKHFESWYIS